MKDQMEELFEEAFRQFLSEERLNIMQDVNERNLCGRLGRCLERVKNGAGLSAYYVDPEYNRNQGKVKTILDDVIKVVRVNCDLLLHSRGEIVERDNLIAIEMKKADRPEAKKQEDRDRLRALTKATYDDDVWSYDGKTLPAHVCGYELGVFVELDVKKAIFRVEKYRRGNRVDVCDGKF